MQISGNNIINQTPEEEQAQEDYLNKLLLNINNENHQFNEAVRQQKEAEQELERLEKIEEERKQAYEAAATFHLVAEEERQKILKAIAEDEEKEAERNRQKNFSFGIKRKKEEPAQKEKQQEIVPKKTVVSSVSSETKKMIRQRQKRKAL